MDASQTQIYGLLNVTGDVVAYYSSDPALKQNMQRLVDPIGTLKKLAGYSFTWNSASDHKGWAYGLNANQVQKALPYAVITRQNGYKAVDYKQVIPLMVEVGKVHEARIESNTARIARLEKESLEKDKKIAALERRLTA